jgi:hypothetical protein
MSTAGTVPVDSKSAKKRKAKIEATSASGSATMSNVEANVPPTETQNATNGFDAFHDSPFLKDLTKYLPLACFASYTTD